MKLVKFAVWDLDGTIIDTESLCVEAANEVVGRYGKTLTSEMTAAVSGQRALDLYSYLAKALDLPKTPEELYQLSQRLLLSRFEKAPLMPGVLRLLEYFKKHKIPMALATSTVRDNIINKLKGKEYILDFFREIVGGDEVEKGKPDPDIFLLAADRLKARVEDCVVFEDSIAGVKGASLAGMEVIFVPSIPDLKLDEMQDIHIVQLKSLLDFNPLHYGLPPISDSINGVIKMNPIFALSGTVVKGFGRGAKELGIRTANIDEESLADELSSAVTGIYAGWASVGSDPTVYKMVMSIGWNPFYKNQKKTAEAWLLHDFAEDFYGAHMRLIVCGYIRPEADFTSLQNLIAKIHQDANIAEEFLNEESIVLYKTHVSLHPNKEQQSD